MMTSLVATNGRAAVRVHDDDGVHFFLLLFSTKSDFQVNSREDRVVEKGGD